MTNTRLEAVKHVLEIIGFDEEAVTFMITGQKVTNITRLRLITDNQHNIYITQSEGKVTQADLNELKIFKRWISEFCVEILVSQLAKK